MNKKIVFIILGILLVGTLAFIYSQPKSYSNPPCYYYTNKSTGTIKLDGINSTDINLYVNGDKTKFIITNKLTNETLPECV